jgi:3-oxoacyl-(acyl-carrier-protein) synthase
VERTVGQLFGMFSGPPPTDGPPRVYDVLAPRFYNMQAFLYVHMVGKALGLHGFSTSVHNACSSGAFAIELAAQRIRAGHADVMVVAGGEAFDTAVRLEWFRRLGLYAGDDRMCPFDAGSSGFYVGEGAAAIILESAGHAQRRGAAPYAVYQGGAFAQQSFKQSTPDLRAARLRVVIRSAMTGAGISPADVDLIVPHGAATAISDGYEASCLAAAFQEAQTSAVATAFKPHYGHMLAASGIIDTIASLLAMKMACVPATLHSRADCVGLAVPLVTERLDRPSTTLLKLCTGFTGHDAAVIFSRS